ncbi:MAG: COX15/CtaA family protein [Alphaproteobacteria bacterium]|nr:COX15/CtaA family protein [Alphaproteobacteria bacterium]MDE2631164.1 COX15/CtaA family protein [Alphaproteobacteria bacterium]
MDILSALVPQSQSGRRAAGLWLLAVAALIVAMLAVGGLTRLTGSGLSITQWDPIVGAIPPLGDAAWHDAFAKYQQIPQYRLENHGMSLEGFKAIFWWEWAHRFLGRAIGCVFFVPFVWFAWSGAIGRKDWPRMVLLLALGGLQGFVGWWMVESGLETRVSVSQYRLAIHLGVAVILLGAILWTALEYLRAPSPGALRAPAFPARGEAKMAFVFVALVFVQMLLGALVAGLHAGHIDNTWPLMDGRLTPEHPFLLSPRWINFFENPGVVQFDHRIVAYLVAGGAFTLWSWGRRIGLTGLARRSSDAVLYITLIQVVLGIATLLLEVPIALAALHQVVAALLFCAAVWHAFELRYAASNP